MTAPVNLQPTKNCGQLFGQILGDQAGAEFQRAFHMQPSGGFCGLHWREPTCQQTSDKPGQNIARACRCQPRGRPFLFVRLTISIETKRPIHQEQFKIFLGHRTIGHVTNNTILAVTRLGDGEIILWGADLRCHHIERSSPSNDGWNASFGNSWK